jgi:hypothetical protein
MSRALQKGWIEIELGQHIYISGRIGGRGLKADEYTRTAPVFLSVPNLTRVPSGTKENALALLRSLSPQGVCLFHVPSPRLKPRAIACRPWRD